MGQNKRYPGHTIQREVERSLTRPQPIELTDEELDFTNHPITEAPAPIPVTAWVRFHEATIRPEAEAIAWTDRAVKIRWQTGTITGHFITVWVWASAVDRR